jgi:hypothetical protein
MMDTVTMRAKKGGKSQAVDVWYAVLHVVSRGSDQRAKLPGNVIRDRLLAGESFTTKEHEFYIAPKAQVA